MKNDPEMHHYAMEKLRYCMRRLAVLDGVEERANARQIAADYAVIALALRD